MTLAIPTTWHAGPYALSPDLVNYFPHGIWLMISSYGVDELIHVLSDDKILAQWIKQTNLRVFDNSSVIEMIALGVRHNPFGGPARIDTWPDGHRSETWYKYGKLHRIDGPASIHTNPSGGRSEQWYVDDKQHRIGGPAYIETYPDGRYTEIWYENGKLHRIGEPAHIKIESNRREEMWYENDKLHRIDGPAHMIARKDGYRWEIWYKNGLRHRIGGPAHTYIYPEGDREEKWYKNGNIIPNPH